ncbi:MAG: cation acetate symporter [Planctomycetaceae bacterium]
MIHEPSVLAVVLFLSFVGFTLGLSFWLGRKAKSSEGYFAAHGQIPWFVNGIAFAGDYLSAASFLGICGMIAFYGYDGFLYSIGYLAGWIVALFVIAEPMKRMGRFTFADALDAKFNSRGIKLSVGISTLVVSVFYLIPQMVGAGALVQPLLGFPHWVGVVLVGAVVMLIVVTAGMVSTTWVQFLKGSLLVVFSAVLTWMILERGFSTPAADQTVFRSMDADDVLKLSAAGQLYDDSDESRAVVQSLQEKLDGTLLPPDGSWKDKPYLRFMHQPGDRISVWRLDDRGGHGVLSETQTTSLRGEQAFVNGLPKGVGEGQAVLRPTGRILSLPDGKTETGPLSLLGFFQVLQKSEVELWRKDSATSEAGLETTIYYPKPSPGSTVLRPGEHPTFAGIRGDSFFGKLNFLSLMLALFCGTASLPHILIRYYTVKDESSARKSTIVGIASIGFFYVLTLYLGLGAMTSGALDVTDSNMCAPLLAKSMNLWLFAAISAIAFTTVLGTVSGLILASAGAVTHDLMSSVLGWQMNDHEKVRMAKLASIVVGVIAIVLGIVFKDLNVNYLVGWAFSIAASANLPSLVMILFWRGVTKQGVISAVTVGMISSLSWILLSGDTFKAVYQIKDHAGFTPFSQPGIVTIPLGFLTLILVSLMTARPTSTESPAASPG